MKYTGKKHLANKRILLAAVLFAVGLACIVLRFFGMRFTGFLCIGIGVLLILSALLGQLAEVHKVWRWIKRLFYAGIIVGVLGFCVLEGQVLYAGHSTPEKGDAVIVLGAGVNGTQPSLALQSRLDAAVAYAGQYPEIPIVLSGGQGYGEDITEAECMRRYLTAAGVDEDRLLLEEAATDTEENFRCSKELLQAHGYDPEQMTIAVVSNDFHLFRAGILAQREGLTVTGVGAPIPWLHLEINYYIREAFALVKTYFL